MITTVPTPTRAARRGVAVLTGAILTAAALAGCGTGPAPAAPAPADVITGEFVGNGAAAPGTPAEFTPLVALVAERPASPGAERAVRLYLCDGRSAGTDGLLEWFPGVATGNTVSLTAESGTATATVELTPQGVTGTITLPRRPAIPFDLKPVTGVAGLYDVLQMSDGRIVGSSFGGGTLDLTVLAEAGDTVMRGRFAGADGTTVQYDGPYVGMTRADDGTWSPTGEFRFIVDGQGRAVGGKKGRSTGGTSGGNIINIAPPD